MQSAHIAYSYLANVLVERERARIVAYTPVPHRKWYNEIYEKIAQVMKVEQYGAYVSFGVSEFFVANPSNAQKSQAKQIFERLLPKLRSKRDVICLTINNVWIGDLIYDSYLRTFSEPTIDINSPKFLDFLLESIELLMFWEAYFRAYEVRAINVSHCVYNLAIPMRVAISKGIPAFQANVTHLYRLDPQKLFAYTDFHYFPERFAELSEHVRVDGLKIAKQQIDKRFNGEIGVNMTYSTKSAYGVIKEERLLMESPRKKIFVALHMFFDSPHPYGKTMFADFYEWCEFLGEVSECTDYDWYIKTHPDYLPGTIEIVQELVNKFPKFTWLPADASHHQIISEGIDLALTVYGTIGFEYAALGIPVINASLSNPHIAYDFNLHPKSIEEYRTLLIHPDLWSLNIDVKQVHEYYFMRYIHNNTNLFFDDYQALEVSMGGASAQFTPAVYDRWIEEFSPTKHEEIMSAVHKFVRSGDFRMDYSHFNGKKM